MPHSCVEFPELTAEFLARTDGRIPQTKIVGQGINRWAVLEGPCDAEDLRQVADFLDEVEERGL